MEDSYIRTIIYLYEIAKDAEKQRQINELLETLNKSSPQQETKRKRKLIIRRKKH